MHRGAAGFMQHPTRPPILDHARRRGAPTKEFRPPMTSRFSILLVALLLAAPVLAQQPQQAQPTAQQPANGNAQAAAPVQSQPPAQDQATAQLDQATKDLKRLSAAVDGARDDDNRLADIKVEVDAVGKRIIATSVATRPRLGDRVRFVVGTGRNGAPAAVQVEIVGANPLDRAAGKRGLPQRQG